VGPKVRGERAAAAACRCCILQRVVASAAWQGFNARVWPERSSLHTGFGGACKEDQAATHLPSSLADRRSCSGRARPPVKLLPTADGPLLTLRSIERIMSSAVGAAAFQSAVATAAARLTEVMLAAAPAERMRGGGGGGGGDGGGASGAAPPPEPEARAG
jgi:hypothetical protein